MKVKIFHKIAYKFGYFLDIDKFWPRFDIMACIVHKVVKELDIAEC